jgi:TolB protein
MDTDGGDQKNITNAPNSNESLPAGAPAGDRILFTTDRDGNLEVYWMTTDGTGQENISRNGAEDRMPAWSPDNRYIAFTSKRTGNEEIFIMEGIFGTPINLTNNSAADNHANWR